MGTEGAKWTTALIERQAPIIRRIKNTVIVTRAPAHTDVENNKQTAKLA